MKMTSKWRWPQNEEGFKNEDNLLKYKDNLKYEVDLKGEDKHETYNTKPTEPNLPNKPLRTKTFQDKKYKHKN